MADLDADRDIREFNRYTGDGLPYEPDYAPLPVGDPRSGPYHIPKWVLRALIKQMQDGLISIETLKEYIEGLSGDILAASEVPIFSSRSVVEAATVNAGHSVIRINGRTTAGQGGAYYKRVGSSSHPFKVTDVSGAIFEPTLDPALLYSFVSSNATTTVTVGTGGHFPDLQDAIDKLGSYQTIGRQEINLQIISPLTKGLLVFRDCDQFKITSAIGTVTLDASFVGVSNEFFEDYGANTMATIYRSTKNLIVGHRAALPRLECLIDMASPRGAGRLGHGITLSGGSAYIGGGSGILNAGLCGIVSQNADLYGIESIFSGSGAENIRIQQASSVTFQGATADDGMVETTAGLSSSVSGAAVFISRASSANLANIKIRNSKQIGIESHSSVLRLTEAIVTGSAGDNARFELTSVVGASGADFSGAGRDAVGVAQHSIVGLNGANLSGCARNSLYMYNGGGTVNISSTTTKTGAPGVPNFADVDGVPDVNWPTANGVVHANLDGPLQRLGIRSVGVFDQANASNAKTFSDAAVLDSARDSNSDTAQAHIRFFNRATSGGGLKQVGVISTALNSTLYLSVSDGRLKANRRPGAEEISALEFLMALQVWGYDWTDGTRDIGLIAQELHRLKPSAVSVGSGEPGEDGFVPWSVDYSKLMPEVLLGMQSLIEANSELSKNYSDLAMRVASLEGKL